MDTATTLSFADGEYRFWLPMSRVIAAEREAGTRAADGTTTSRSLFSIFNDIGQAIAEHQGDVIIVGDLPARLTDCRAVIRHALIGGGEGQVDGADVKVTETLAHSLVETYCYPNRPAIYEIKLTWDILKAAIYGISLKKKTVTKPTKAKARKRSARVSSSRTADNSASIGGA